MCNSFAVFMTISEHSPGPSSSWWDVEHEELLHGQSILPGTVEPHRPSPFLHPNTSRSSLSQNLDQKSQEKQLSCDVLLKLSRYISVDIFGPGLAWNLFRLYNCDRDAKLPKIPNMYVSPLKMVRHKLRPFLLHRMLRMLGNMGVLTEGQQHKVFALLKEHMLKARKIPPKPKAEHSGRYSQRCFLILCLAPLSEVGLLWFTGPGAWLSHGPS